MTKERIAQLQEAARKLRTKGERGWLEAELLDECLDAIEKLTPAERPYRHMPG